MRLYHGTTFAAAEKIEKCLRISHDIDRPYYTTDDLQTTNGYVYLTNNVGYAAYLAQRTSLLVGDDYCVVYSVELDDSELLADNDQLRILAGMDIVKSKNVTALDSLMSVQSCQVARSLAITVDVTEKITLPSSLNDSHPDYQLLCKLRQLRKPGQAEEAFKCIPQSSWVQL